ncbi:cilia- and flagella-associated protein 47-like [Diabrotica virgifera virgifera]|uniref:Calponin-homology (CH) domain-containing protein n=1 Tax=Diabrotica virgifera virgifera TaxID=50390 RepID=A0ABM5I9Q9_DIAVI|nr:cilia- and flagella-associated protein 47-like [Diabrotica virgifera virgifera]
MSLTKIMTDMLLQMPQLDRLERESGEPVGNSETGKEFLELDNVRVYPRSLVFAGAYDGKVFLEKFQIINVGKIPAFVRVMPPTSKAFKMKPLPKGTMLSSGLSITRYIKYTHCSAVALSQIFITLYINEKPFLYELEVYLNQAIVKTSPKMLHFGDIDVGTASEQLSVHLHNEGEKVTTFVVDLGRHDLELIIDPMKGTIKPSEIVEIKVEILGSREGKFLKEFWIKTDPPQRIYITGTFIMPQLKLEHPFSNFDLIVIHFPKTYYNAESIRALVVKNSSSTNSMFCTMAIYKNEEKKLDEARKTDQSLRFFKLAPKEGRLTKNHKAAIIVRFVPRRLRSFTQKYCIAMIKIVKVNFRDGVIKGKDIEVKTFSSLVDAEQFQICSLNSIDENFKEFPLFPSHLNLCLYGEIEEPNVKLTPHSTERDDLCVGQVYNFTFNIQNGSRYLPITFKYHKYACFEMEPDEMTLKANANVDVLLMLKPSTIGDIETDICLCLTYKANGHVYKVGNAYFHVRYRCHKDPSIISPMLKRKFNMGITPAITDEVGFLVDNTKFGDAKDAPIHAFINVAKRNAFLKQNTNIVAFPNDRPRILRPWTSSHYQTIFAHIPRIEASVDNYMLTESEALLKEKNKQKYIDFIRTNRTKTVVDKTLLDDIYPTSPEKVLLTKETIKHCPLIFTEKSKPLLYLPLIPEQLMGIEVNPHYIQLGKIAPYISCSDFFTIANKNEFPVVISIVALSNSVIVKGKKRIKIAPFSTEKLYFDCFSQGLGKYYVPVYIIINDCHIFNATVFAEVVPTTVKCKLRDITINPKDNVAFVELFNPVNCAIDFSWNVQDKCYSIMPSCGTLDSRRSLYCKIVFTPSIAAVFKTEVILYSQSGAKQVLNLAYKNPRPSILFNTDLLEFKDIPLNMRVSKTLVLKNNSANKVVMYVKEPKPMEEITVTPRVAVIPGKSTLFFQVFAHFRTVQTFKCVCNFTLQDEYDYQVNIEGDVCYPTISVKPNSIQYQKIPTGASHRKVFKLENTSESKLSVNFDFDLYRDFRVVDMANKTVDSINIDPHAFVNLYLEFEPLEPTAYTFYVPMVLNNLVGPPLLNNPKSFEYSSYFDDQKTGFEKPSKTMVGLRVTCAAGAPWFKFSSFSLSFTSDAPTNTFQVTNISNISRDIKLMTENMDACFSVEVENSSGAATIKEKYISLILEPEQSVTFLFSFKTQSHGIFESKLLFYVGDYFGNCPFNFVRLYATTTQPTIVSKTKMIYIPVIPIKTKFTKTVEIGVNFHQENCKLKSLCTHDFLKSEIKSHKKEEEDGKKYKLVVTFYPKEECETRAEVIIGCSCNASCEIGIIASSSNNALLSYRHRMKWYVGDVVTRCKSHEYFGAHNNDVLQEKVNRMREILENFFYSQGFFTTSFYRIPETIARYPFDLYRQEKERRIEKKKVIHLPIVSLLRNLADASIVNEIVEKNTSASLDDNLGTSYDYAVYRNALSYLERYGVFTNDIRPEFLLTYIRYITLRESNEDITGTTNGETVSEEEFSILSEETWLDFLIRIYKLFFYDRLLSDKIYKTGKMVIHDHFEEALKEYHSQNDLCFSEKMDKAEINLLVWLEFHFQSKKDKLWPDKDVPTRQIRDLSVDIRDSLPLITLLATYCPYLEDLFKEIYFEPFTDHGQLLHNACLVSEAWNKLELSYTISTNNIVSPTNSEMLILLMYLYTVLPGFYPTDQLTINSNLGESSSVHVVLKNPGNTAISFKANLFLNDNGSFRINANTVVIEPQKEKTVQIFYTAKQIINENAVLVLSGETGLYKYCRSSAINLTGIPNILYCTDEYIIELNMYQYTEKFLTVTSPYCQSYEAYTCYYIYDSTSLPSTMEDFISLSSYPNLPRQLNIDTLIRFNENGTYKLRINLCFVTCGTYEYYVYFVSKEIGVFCIKLTIESTLSEDTFEELKIRIPSNFDTHADCKCKRGAVNSLCPRVIKAAIPFQNPKLLEGLRRMMHIHADSSERDFWNKHLVFPRGFHILREYLKINFDDILIPFKRILDSEVVYTTKARGRNYSPEGKIHIKDVTDEGIWQLFIHWDAQTFPGTEILYLKSDHEQELRKYNLTFWTREKRIY